MDHPAAPAADARFYSVKPPSLHCMHAWAGRACKHTIHTIRRFIDTFQTYICMYPVRCATAPLVALSLCVLCVPMTKQLPGSRNTTASNYEPWLARQTDLHCTED